MVAENQDLMARKLGMETLGCEESNGIGGDHPRMATAPDRVPKVVNRPTADWLQIGFIGGCGWSEMEVGGVRSKNQFVVRSNSGRIDGGKNGLRLRLFKLDRRLTDQFSVTRIGGERRPALELQFGTKLRWWDGQSCEIRLGWVASFRA